MKSWAYIDAYLANLDIIQAHDFVKKQKKHRGLLKKIEKEIEKAAFDLVEEEAQDDVDDNSDVDDAAEPIPEAEQHHPAKKARLGVHSKITWQEKIRRKNEKEAMRDDSDADDEGEFDDDQVIRNRRAVKGEPVIPKKILKWKKKEFLEEFDSPQGSTFMVQSIRVVQYNRQPTYWCLCNPTFGPAMGGGMKEFVLSHVDKGYKALQDARVKGMKK
jgi:hypothetical protein